MIPLELDDIIHAKIRLAILSILVMDGEADYSLLQEKLKTTDGNLASHLRKVEDAGYLDVKKTFLGRRPKTIYKLTKKGREAFGVYIRKLEDIISSVK